MLGQLARAAQLALLVEQGQLARLAILARLAPLGRRVFRA